MTLLSRRACLAAIGGSLVARTHAVGFHYGTYGMKNMSTADALRLLAGIGYDGVELCLIPGWPSVTRETGDHLRQYRLDVSALLDSLTIASGPDRRVEYRERVRRAAALAHDLAPHRPPCLDTVLGGRDADWDTRKEGIADEIREWARIAEAEDFTIGVKPHADQALNTPDKCLWLMRQVGSRRIGLIYDYGHMHLGGFSLESSFHALRPHILNVSVKDARRRAGKNEYLLPGEGDTDYVAYFRLLRRVGYAGAVSVEVSSMVQNAPGYDPAAAARFCYQRLAPAFEAGKLTRPSR